MRTTTFAGLVAGASSGHGVGLAAGPRDFDLFRGDRVPPIGLDQACDGKGPAGAQGSAESLSDLSSRDRTRPDEEVELAGLEPATSWVRSRRSPS